MIIVSIKNINQMPQALKAAEFSFLLAFKSVAYDKMTAILVEAVKEQHRQFSEQQKKMDKLAEENASLRSELVQLRSLQSHLNELKDQVAKNYRDK